MKDSNNLSRGACADDVKLWTRRKRDYAHSRSVEVVSGVRIVQCHAIIDVVIDVRVVLCDQATDNSGFFTF